MTRSELGSIKKELEWKDLIENFELNWDEKELSIEYLCDAVGISHTVGSITVQEMVFSDQEKLVKYFSAINQWMKLVNGK